MVWSEYTWIFAISVICALFVAWGIGANDVANSFATSVGARALTLRQAILVASVCEFGGAVLLGSGVTDTIKSGIAKTSAYVYQPELLMYGMLCALASAGIWLALATFLELPVSTTHSIVGAIIGMSMVAAGPDSIIWTSAPKPGSPFPGGVVAIILAWFITPAMAAVVAALLFTFTKLVVLHSKNPFRRALMLFPLYTFITFWVITYFVIQKGVNGWIKAKTYTNCPSGATAPAKNYKTVNGEQQVTGCTIPDGTNAWISTVVASIFTIICIIALRWIAKLVERDMAALEAMEIKMAEKHPDTMGYLLKGTSKVGEAKVEEGEAHEVAVDNTEAKNGQGPVKPEHESGGDSPVGSANDVETKVNQPRIRTPKLVQDMRKSRVWQTLSYGSKYDIHESVADDKRIMSIHQEAEVFDRKSEGTFKYLQVLTACANSFAHGANDVANSIGSMAAVYQIWQCACVTSKANVPIWMFVIGGVGLVIGLATYGYKIMRVLGVKVTRISNSRGYCAELTSAIIVIIASRYGFPVSTTQVITGAITGIGLQEVITARIKGLKSPAKRFNFLLLLKFFAGWVATLVVAGLTAAAFTAQGIYSPNKFVAEWRTDFNSAFNTTNVGISKTLIAAGNTTSPSPAEQQALLWGQEIANATKLTWQTNNMSMLNPSVVLATFQIGSWYLGNTTLVGVLTNTYMPIMPLEGLPTGGIE